MTDSAREKLSEEDRLARLQVLLVEYEGLRDDERTGASNLTTLASIAVALLFGIGAAVYQLDVPPGEPEAWGLLVLPLAPYALFVYAMILGAAGTLRSFYLRAIEREIAALVPGNLSIEYSDFQQVPWPSYTHLLHSINSQNHGSRTFQFMYSGLWLAIITLLFVVSVGTSLTVAEGWIGVLAALGYATLILSLMIPGRRVTVNGHSTWLQALAAMHTHWERPLGQRSHEEKGHRSVRSYVLMPRPKDLIKWAFIPIGGMIGAVLYDGPQFSVSMLILAFLAFEYLVYQARYTWNDLRDGPANRLEPGRHQERIPPGGEVPAALSMVVRLVVWMLVCIATWQQVGPAILVAGVSALLLAVLYERARDRASFQKTWTSTATSSMRAVYALVGVGYAIRAAFGLWLGAGPQLEISVVGFAILMAWALGVAFVVMTWTIDSHKFLLAADDDALEAAFFDWPILLKAHVMPLVSATLKRDPVPYDDAQQSPEVGGEHAEGVQPPASGLVRQVDRRPLAVVGSWSLWSNCAVLAAIGAAGVALVDPRLMQISAWLLLSIAAGLAVTTAAGRLSIPASYGLLLASVAGLLAIRWWTDNSDSWLGWLTFLPGLVVLAFRQANQTDLSRDMSERIKLSKAALSTNLALIARRLIPKPRPAPTDILAEIDRAPEA